MHLFAIALFVAAALFAQTTKPPIAKKVPKAVTMFGDTRTDDYGWIRDKASPDTIAYLESENAYAEAFMKIISDAGSSILGEGFVAVAVNYLVGQAAEA